MKEKIDNHDSSVNNLKIQLQSREELLILMGLDQATIAEFSTLSHNDLNKNKVKENLIHDFSASNIPKVLFQLIVDEKLGITFTYISKSIEKVYTDVTVDKVLKDSACLLNRVHQDDLPKLLSTLQYAIDHLTEWKIEFKNYNEDGSIVWMNIRAFPKKIENNLTLFNGISENFSTSKSTEVELNKIQARFTNLAQYTSDGIIIFDQNHKIEYVSPGYLKQLGYSYDEQINRTTDQIYQNIHPEDRDRIFSDIFKSIAIKNRTLLYTYRIKNILGNYIWREDNAYFNFDEDENYLGAYVICRDITKAKQEEQHLKLLESVILNTNDAVLITEAEPMDEPGPRIIYVNEAFTKLTGYTSAEVLGKTPRILQGPKSDKDELKKLSVAMRKWKKHEITVLNYKKDGEEFWNNFTICPIANEKGWFTHWIAIEKDVTELKNNELLHKLLADISGIFSIEHNIESAIKSILNKISELQNFLSIDAYLVDDFSKEQILIAQLNLTSNEHLKISKYLANEIIEKGKFKIWNADEFERKNAAYFNTIGVPLKLHNKVIGAIILKLENEINNEKFIIKALSDASNLISTEVERKKLESQLSQIFDIAPDIICIAGLDGYFKKINPATVDILGFSEKELLSKPYIEFIHPDDKSKTINEHSLLKNNIVTYYFENRYISKSGKIVWLAWTATPLTQENIIYAVAKDITEKKELENLLQKASEMAMIGSWEIHVNNNNELFLSSITKEIYDIENDFSPTLDDFINYIKGDDVKDFIKSLVNKTIQDQVSWVEEFIIITKNGEEKWVRTICQGEFVSGKCIKLYGSIQDIHNRKKVELQLKENVKALEDYKFALDESSIVEITDENGTITFVNDNFTLLSKFSKEEVLGNNHSILNSGYHSKEFIDDINNTISQGKVWRDEIKNKAKDGSYFWVDTTIVPFLNDDNKPYQYLFIRKDITEKKLLEIQRIEITNDLIQRNRDLEQFNFIISHNLRAPTANIIALAEILNDPDLDDLEKNEFLSRLSTSVNLLDSVIKDINTILQIKSDVNEQKEEIQFSTILKEVKTSIRTLIEKNNVQITSDFESIDHVFTLKIFIYSIFYNLINNSIKYAKPTEPAKIHIQSKAIKNKIYLYFTDNGLGIDLKTKGNKIFGLYKRFHSHVEGKGMGLFMVKSQVESLGGKIYIESELNVGTKFTIELKNIAPVN